MRPTEVLLQSCLCTGWSGQDLRFEEQVTWGQKKLASMSHFQDYPIIPKTFIKTSVTPMSIFKNQFSKQYPNKPQVPQ